MIHLLKEKAVPAQVQDMLQEYENMIKIVVDIRRRYLSGGGEMHADLWGANWYPSEQRIEFE